MHLPAGQQALPPRPVSPIKVARLSSPPVDVAALEEKLLDAQDEIAALKDEREELKSRVAELEADRLSTLQKDASTSDSDKDARILELTKENQELLVIVRNADVEGEMKRQERKYERQLEKHRLYQEGLESTLEQERQVRRSFCIAEAEAHISPPTASCAVRAVRTQAPQRPNRGPRRPTSLVRRHDPLVFSRRLCPSHGGIAPARRHLTRFR